MHVLMILQSAVAGVLMPIQAGINAQLHREVGHPVGAAFVSFFVGTVALVVLYAILYLGARAPAPAIGKLVTAPWYLVYSGGLIGVFAVFTMLTLAPKLGASVLIASFLTGQMIASVALDHYGVLGYAEHPVNLWRLLGVGFLIAGVFLIRRF